MKLFGYLIQFHKISSVKDRVEVLEANQEQIIQELHKLTELVEKIGNQ